MGVYIKGMEMPKKGNIMLLITPDGDVWLVSDWPCDDKHTDAKAIPVPPHGRCIDADALIATENQHYALFEDEWYVTVRKVELMPTIIEAEEND